MKLNGGQKTGMAARLEDLNPGALVGGVVGDGAVTVVAVRWIGSNALQLTYRTEDGRLDERLLYPPGPRQRCHPDLGSPMSRDHPQHTVRLNAACSSPKVRPDDARRRHAQAIAVLRHSPRACLWRRTQARRATLTLLADVPPLCDRIDQLRRFRRQHQDLEAAARTTLAAHADGEADPCTNLRDELEAARLSEGHGQSW